MPLIPLRPLLECAVRHGYGQGAFNVNAVAQAEAALEIHEVFRAPLVLQGADLANGFMGGRADFMNAGIEDKIRGARLIGHTVRRLAAASTLPVVLHLDHGRDMASVKAAIDGGYTSVMIDGSSLPFDDNVDLTREVVRYAHPLGVSVEGELGVLAGVEDHVFSEGSTYTHPLKAVDFIRRTGVDALAISYGTMHGASKGKDVRLRQAIPLAIRECLQHERLFCALVSHGSSTVPQYIVEDINRLGGQVEGAQGIPMAELKSAITCGITKINVDTDIRLAVTRNFRELFQKDPALRQAPGLAEVWRLLQDKPTAVDPRVFLAPLMDMVMTGRPADPGQARLSDCLARGVKEAVGSLIVSFDMLGKAPLVERADLEDMARRYRQAGI